MSSIDETTDHEDHEPTSQNPMRHQKPERQPDVLSTISEEFDAEEEEKLVKKLDIFILPIMAIVYLFQYVDKNSISYAAVFGLITDLELTERDFSWAVSSFYIGQLISQFPTACWLSYSRIIIFIGTTLVAGGIVEICIAFAENLPVLAALRYGLGFAQAAVSPAFIILTSNWYRQHEHPMRVAAWISMNGISQIVGGILMYALSDADMAISSWRVMFLIFGGLTVMFGILFTVMIPEKTTTAWFLNQRERHVATKRLAIDRASGARKGFDIRQLREALSTPLSWLYVLMAFCIASTNPITKVYSSIVIRGAGFSESDTMLAGLPTGLLNFATSWISALIPHFFPNTRIYTAIGLSVIPLAGSMTLSILSCAEDVDSWGIVASTWLASCYTAPLCSCAGLLASNVQGNTKKSIVGAGFFVAYSVGSIVGPQVWGAEDDPEDDHQYLAGSIFTVVNWVMLMSVLLIYLVMVRRENKIRDREASKGLEESSAAGQDMRDRILIGEYEDSELTDSQDKRFRYST
ncbi:major facilitator superfamily domain-containing protein [Fusarium flagelliforme]|uniref:Major facilitator superfamily transporter n=1 Tax=Fusarium flagelliforme TaxID=2675880 RepID=A0A395MHJ2_9HYPO|nr:major facilitator superfamily domain-containing protein [Fusarium flagelliforme]KAH7193673.1 major facilitator superfamily domain-containing protein [Fusarium flagelliforme]RFN47240.1 major facilitator superfamily transporter [Fusarium flagelliforme]